MGGVIKDRGAPETAAGRRGKKRNRGRDKLTTGHKAKNIDWEAEYTARIDPESRNNLAGPDDWREAANSGNDGVIEMMTVPGAIHHDRMNGVLVGFGFTFSADPEGNITAHGTCYPAEETPEGIQTHRHNPLARAELQVHPCSPEGRELYLELIGWNPPVENGNGN